MLEVGKTYQLSYEVTSDAATNVLLLIGTSGVTTLGQDLAAIVGTKRVTWSFTVDSESWSGEVRCGSGVAANSTVNVIVRDPKVIEVV